MASNTANHTAVSTEIVSDENKVKKTKQQFNNENVRQKFQTLEAELNQCVFERKHIVRGSLIALLTNSNVLQLGSPGTAKSHLTRLLSKVFNANYFQYLLGKNTNPDELFGPVSLTNLRQDKYVRVTTNKAPQAHIIFYDETFKGSSAILNANLTLANEHLFDDGTGLKLTPLVSLFGASNELPEPNTGLEAMYDRFLIRFWVDYICDAGNFGALLMGGNKSEPSVTIMLDELYFAQEQVNNVELTEDVVASIVKLRNELKNRKVFNSDRRFKDSMKLLKANAWIEGRTETNSDDLEVLENVLWNTPDQIDEVKSAIAKVADPNLSKARTIFNETKKKYNEAMQDGSSEAAVTFMGELKDRGEELTKIFTATGGKRIESNGEVKYTGGNVKIAQMLTETRQWRTEISQNIKDDEE